MLKEEVMKSVRSYRFSLLMMGSFLLCLLSGFSIMSNPAKQLTHVPEGFVPNEKTAVRIAEAVLIPIYGEEKINSEKPFSAKLNEQGDVWTVNGHLPGQYNRGGVATVEIEKNDGRILQVWHGK
jgi:NTF2 fold immunity protein